jgi:ammonium transporter, Amt family
VGYAEGIDMGQQVTTQLIGVGVTVLWSGIITLVILGLIYVTVGLRVSREEEIEGLDLSLHNETAYNP